jgi:hypothetical protein
MSSTANTLVLYNAVGILTDLLDSTEDITLCDNCGDELGDTSWNICSGPVAPLGTPIPEYHDGHTACTKCAMDPIAYIAEGGACRPCLDELGGRRSSVIKAGVALRPPVRNVLANKMINCCTIARTQVSDAQEAQDVDRRQEGVQRRAAAVEDVRRRRTEASEDARRLCEEAEQVRAQAQCVKERAEEDARISKETIEENARVAKERIEDDARAADQHARISRELIEENARLANDKIEEDARVANERIEEDQRTSQSQLRNEAEAFASRISGNNNPPPSVPNTRTRKRKPQSQESINRRIDAARVTNKLKKCKIEQYDIVVMQNEILLRQVSKSREIARNWIVKTFSMLSETTAESASRLRCGTIIQLMEDDMQRELDSTMQQEAEVEDAEEGGEEFELTD